jgi:hypothetical protein
MGVDVSMALQNIHNFKGLIAVSKEDDVAFERHASDTRSQFGSITPQSAGQRRQFGALISNLFDKPPPTIDIPALAGNEIQYGHEVISRRGEKDETPHSAAFPLEFGGLGFDGVFDVTIIERSTLRDGRVERLLQRSQLRLALLDQTQSFADNLASRSIASAFDDAFHKAFPAASNGYIHRFAPMVRTGS